MYERTGNYKKGLLDLINHLQGNDLVGAEIGSFGGGSAKLFAESEKIDTLYCIDIWKNGYDISDSAAFHAENSEKYFDEIAKSNNKIVKIKKDSVSALENFEDDYLDFVYIDACHTYESSKRDIINWVQKVKPNGYVCGHDYTHTIPHVIGVFNAVNEVIGSGKIKVFDDTSWCVRRDELK